MKPTTAWPRKIAFLASLGAVGLLIAASSAPPPTVRAVPRAEGTYIGASKCKSCHSSEEVGNQYGAWQSAKHSKAFETLASDRAKAIAKERGIEDPQKADECLTCHTTAFGVDEKHVKKGFKREHGVQCESCHGPGQDHMKARFAAAMSEDADQTPAPGEIVSKVERAQCLTCHNEKSPTFEGFCFCEMLTKIRHLRPGTTPEPIVCQCEDSCKCKTEGCAASEK